MKSSLIRKQDSDVNVLRKIVRQEMRQSGSSGSSTGAKFTQNYSFSSGGSSGSTLVAGNSTSYASYLNADVYSDGVIVTVNRAKLQACGGAVLQDNLLDNAVRLTACALNDPMYWLGA